MPTYDELTPAEREVAKLLKLGRSNGQIAEMLGKSSRTIEGQILSILGKLGCSRLEFVAGIRQLRDELEGSGDEQMNLDRLTSGVVDRLREDRQALIRTSESLSSALSRQLSELPASIESVVIRALAQTQPRPRYRLAILGLGRTGIATAAAAKAVGDDPMLVDLRVSPTDLDTGPTPSEQYAKDAARELHVPLLRIWSGPIRELAPDQVIVSPWLNPKFPALQQAIKDGIPVLSEIEYAFRISKAPIVGITGTNGKSTTAVMTFLMLRAAGLDAVLCGRIYGTGYDECPLIEAVKNANPAQILVTEVSCFDLDFVSEFRPKVAAITNVHDTFLDSYGSFAAYLRSKRRLLRKMGAGDTVVCNARQAETSIVPKKGMTLLKWSSAKDNTDADAFMTEDALIICGHTILKRDFPLFLPFHFENALCASLLALGAGADQNDLRWVSEGLKQFKGLAHRFEYVGTRNGVRFVNNSRCSNPAALLHIANSEMGPLKLLVGGVMRWGCFGKELQPALSSHRVYLYGRDAHEINDALGGQWPVFEQMAEALGAAITDAVSGDTIMLAPGCVDLDQFSDFRHRGNTFRSLVTDFLGTQAP